MESSSPPPSQTGERPDPTSIAGIRLAAREALLQPQWGGKFPDFMSGRDRIVSIRCVAIVNMGDYKVPILKIRQGSVWRSYPSVVFEKSRSSFCHISLDLGLVIERSSVRGEWPALLTKAKNAGIHVAGEEFVGKETTESS
ncbi:MAG: hypothetical protein PHS53_04440 [Candidatus Pacebacteria bacterium]|nr:hypothetical protein [Candidatus Paceibacterota bacterium]